MSYREEQEKHKREEREGFFIFAISLVLVFALFALLVRDLDKHAPAQVARACTLVERDIMKSETDNEGNTVTWVDTEQVCE